MTCAAVVEGEKDVETPRRLGLVATCNPHGAGKWRDEYSDSLCETRVSVNGNSKLLCGSAPCPQSGRPTPWAMLSNEASAALATEARIYFRVGEWKELQAVAAKMDIPAARLLRRILRDWLRRHRGKGRK